MKKGIVIQIRDFEKLKKIARANKTPYRVYIDQLVNEHVGHYPEDELGA